MARSCFWENSRRHNRCKFNSRPGHQMDISYFTVLAKFIFSSTGYGPYFGWHTSTEQFPLPVRLRLALGIRKSSTRNWEPGKRPQTRRKKLEPPTAISELLSHCPLTSTRKQFHLQGLYIAKDNGERKLWRSSFSQPWDSLEWLFTDNFPLLDKDEKDTCWKYYRDPIRIFAH